MKQVKLGALNSVLWLKEHVACSWWLAFRLCFLHGVRFTVDEDWRWRR